MLRYVLRRLAAAPLLLFGIATVAFVVARVIPADPVAAIVGQRQMSNERVVAAARYAGLLLYSSTGHVDGRDGDLVMLGPPFVISDDECDLVVDRTAAAIASLRTA